MAPEEIDEIVSSYKAIAQKKLKNKIQDPIKKLRAEKKAQAAVDFYNKVEEIIVEKRKPAPIIESTLIEGNENLHKPSQAVTDRWEEAEKAYGVEETRTLPDGTQVKGRWVMAEADAPTPSHNPDTLQSSEGYPVTEEGKNINDNDYTNKRGEVDGMAHDFDTRAIDNPIIVQKGVVMSGNNRTMSSVVAAKNNTDKKYLAELPSKAKQRGFTAEAIAKFKHPRLYFEMSTPLPFTTETLSKFNQRETKTKNNVEKAIVQSKKTDEKTTKAVNLIANKLDEFERLADFYKSVSAQRDVIKYLLEAGIISQNDVAELQNQTGELSAAGRDFLESVLIGSVIKENQIRLLNLPGMKSYRNKIVKNINALLSNKSKKIQFSKN